MGRTLCLAATVLALSLGCAALGLGGPDCPPPWLLDPPSDATWATGVGQCGRTYIPQDGRDLALARALNEVAAQAGIAIEAESQLVQKLTGSGYVEEWSQWVNTRIEGIIEGFEIVARHDCFDDGWHRYPAGTTFVLIRIRRSELSLRSS